MNNLKIRVFDKEQGRYLNDDEFVITGDGKAHRVYTDDVGELIDAVIELCTGETDANNKQVFEGDLYRHSTTCKKTHETGTKYEIYHRDAIFKVVIEDGRFLGRLIKLSEKPKCDNCNPNTSNFFSASHIEVIGNINENPELYKT